MIEVISKLEGIIPPDDFRFQIMGDRWEKAEWIDILVIDSGRGKWIAFTRHFEPPEPGEEWLKLQEKDFFEHIDNELAHGKMVAVIMNEGYFYHPELIYEHIKDRVYKTFRFHAHRGKPGAGYSNRTNRILISELYIK